MADPSFGLFVSGAHKPGCRCPGCRAKARSVAGPSSSSSSACLWCDGHSSGPGGVRGHEVLPVSAYPSRPRPSRLAHAAALPGVNLPGRLHLPSQCVERPVLRTKCKDGTCDVAVSRAVTCYDFATGESATVELEPELVWRAPQTGPAAVAHAEDERPVLRAATSATFAPSAFPVAGPAAPLYYLHNPVPLEAGSIDDGTGADYYGMTAPAPSPVKHASPLPARKKAQAA